MVKKIVIVGIVLLMLVGIFGCSSKDKEESRKEPIVVEMKPLTSFCSAEEYHQEYLKKNPGGYCHISREKIQTVKDRKLG